MTTTQAAEWVGRSERTIEHWVKAGRIRAVRRPAPYQSLMRLSDVVRVSNERGRWGVTRRKKTLTTENGKPITLRVRTRS